MGIFLKNILIAQTFSAAWTSFPVQKIRPCPDWQTDGFTGPE